MTITEWEFGVIDFLKRWFGRVGVVQNISANKTWSHI